MAHSSGYPTANRAPGLINTSHTPEDSSKPGITKEWYMQRGYFQRPLAKNKAPEAPMTMDYGAMGPFFKV